MSRSMTLLGWGQIGFGILAVAAGIASIVLMGRIDYSEVDHFSGEIGVMVELMADEVEDSRPLLRTAEVAIGDAVKALEGLEPGVAAAAGALEGWKDLSAGIGKFGEGIAGRFDGLASISRKVPLVGEKMEGFFKGIAGDFSGMAQNLEKFSMTLAVLEGSLANDVPPLLRSTGESAVELRKSLSRHQETSGKLSASMRRVAERRDALKQTMQAASLMVGSAALLAITIGMCGIFNGAAVVLRKRA